MFDREAYHAYFVHGGLDEREPKRIPVSALSEAIYTEYEIYRWQIVDD